MINKKLYNFCIDKIIKYQPLIVVFFISFILAFIYTKNVNNIHFMNSFMGYFFVILSMFKFFDLKGFASAFKKYDILAKKNNFYGYLYPFLEFFLGLGHLINFEIQIFNFFTVLLMGISLIGVLKSVLSKQDVKCACLGTVLNVPLTAISIFENLLMGMFSLYELIFQC